MISLFAIVFSAGMVLYITLRAAKLDRIRPWFETRSLYEQEQRREKAAREAAKVQGYARPAIGYVRDPREPGRRAGRPALMRPAPEKHQWD